MRRFRQIFYLLLSCVSVLLCAGRVTVSDLYTNYKNGNLEFCKKHIDEVLQKNPNNSNLIYMQGLIESDGEKSLAFFQEITERNKNGSKFLPAQAKQNEYKRIYALVNPEAVQSASVEKAESDKAEIRDSQTAVAKNQPGEIKLFYLQVGAFSTKVNAEKAVKQLSEYQPFIKSSTNNGKSLFLVFTRAYDSQKEADKIAEKLLKSHNIKSIVKEF